MLAKSLAFTAVVLTPFSAFAHAGEHADMPAFNQLVHMISDPWHLALAGAGIVVGILSWKFYRTYKMKPTQDKE